jgi:cellobiose transport system substrate-binding protein
VIAAGLSSNTRMWTLEWDAGVSTDAFAVTPCPVWLLGYIEEQADPETFTGQWDIADFPGPGGNWGGYFYTIPDQGPAEEQQAAYDFIEWMIQPEQQVALNENRLSISSQTAILESPAVSGLTNAFFNDAPYGEIFAQSVLDIPGAIYHGPKTRAVRSAV